MLEPAWDIFIFLMTFIMLKIAFIIMLIIAKQNLFAISVDSNYYRLCKVWGFLKYYDNEIKKKNINWDERFLDISKSNNISNKVIEESLLFGNEKFESTKSIQKSWISDTFFLSSRISKYLNHLYSTNCNKNSKYVIFNENTGVPFFSQESTINDTLLCNQFGYRFLTFCNLWNTYYYFYPYKKEMNINLDSLFFKYLPLVHKASNFSDYYIVLMKFAFELKDTHTSIYCKYLPSYWGKKVIAFTIKKSGDYFIINNLYQSQENLRIGDTISSINGIILLEKYRYLKSIIQCSNEISTENKVLQYLLFVNENDVEIKKINNNALIKTTTLTFDEVNNIINTNKISLPPIILNDTSIYIDLTTIKEKELDSILYIITEQKIGLNKKIIFDLRGYPKYTNNIYTLSKYIKPSYKPFAVFYQNNYCKVGEFYFDSVENNKYKYDKKNEHKYNSIIVLVNNRTISHAEYVCMLLQSNPATKVIGEKTSGANGNVTTLTLPFGIKVNFSSIGVYYPNYIDTPQGNGIKSICEAPHSLKIK